MRLTRERMEYIWGKDRVAQLEWVQILTDGTWEIKFHGAVSTVRRDWRSLFGEALDEARRMLP